MDYAKFLISLADQLDREGELNKADIIDKDFEEFVKLLENGELDFDFSAYQGYRDPRGPYSNQGR